MPVEKPVPGSPRLFTRRQFNAAAGAALLTAAGCGLGKSDRRPSVVFIVMDTVRADHCSAYGYARPTTPRLASFQQDAVQFSRAITPAPWTLPSHAAFFTGKYPFMTGVHTILTKTDDKEDLIEPPLDDSWRTIAEALRDSGFATGAFVANSVYLTKTYNLHQGFDTYEVERTAADKLAPRATAWLDAQYRKPFFLFVNFIDAHYPFNTNVRPSVVDGDVPQDPERIKRLIEAVMPEGAPGDPELQRAVTAQYDTGIANADFGAGMILDKLKALGILDDTLVIITSDHGEYLGEHRYVGHSKDVYQEALAVPLVIRLPHQHSRETIDKAVSLVDLPGIILGALFGADSLPGFREFMQGNSATFPILAENYYSRRWDIFDPRWGQRFRRERTAIFDWPWKLIVSSDGNDELYQLDWDPAESDNRIGRNRDIAARLREALKLAKPAPAETPVAAPRELSEEEQAEMRALGYLE